MPTKQATPNRQRGRPRGELSREQIARTALDLADRDGLESVTIRRLASELGIGTMTVYGYFRSKEELYDAAVEVATADLEVDLPEGPWEERLRRLMRTIRENLARHPAGIELRLRRPILTPEALRLTETGMRILVEAGFDHATAVRAYRTLFVYTFAFAAFDTPSAPEEVKRATRATLLALPADEYPHLTATADQAGEAMAGEKQFDFGLDALIAGLRTVAS